MKEHGPLAKAALEAGRHVLVERPIATALAQAAELVWRLPFDLGVYNVTSLCALSGPRAAGDGDGRGWRSRA
jgi:hypothetical protein